MSTCGHPGSCLENCSNAGADCSLIRRCIYYSKFLGGRWNTTTGIHSQIQDPCGSELYAFCLTVYELTSRPLLIFKPIFDADFGEGCGQP